jgi:hypothetical protein
MAFIFMGIPLNTAGQPYSSCYREEYKDEGSEFRRLYHVIKKLLEGDGLQEEIREAFLIWLKQIDSFDQLAYQVSSDPSREGGQFYEMYQVNMIRKHNAEALLDALEELTKPSHSLNSEGFIDGSGI